MEREEAAKQAQEQQMKKKQRLFTFKDNCSTDITIDLETIVICILPSFLMLTAEQRNANVAAIIINQTKMDLTYDQVSKIRRAWFEYRDVDPAALPVDVVKTVLEH